jgi:negative regulator of flagellin synthesis FlgM
MKIGPIDPKQATQPVVLPGTERRAQSMPAPVRAPSEASTQVALSPAARLLSEAAADGSGFDSAKVDRIAQAIRDGRFTVNAEAIADKLIANAQELLGGQRR